MRVKVLIMKRSNWFFILFGLFAVKGLYVEASVMRSQNIAQMQSLSPQAEISLLTCSPSDDAVFTLYGHTALRVCDPAAKIDRVYNYGIFEYSKPNFIYRFAKGETDYKLGANHFNYFLFEYMSRGSEVYEQVLNLLPEEKEALYQALLWNEKPENRVYRYNFFFDNCATRPVVMVENNLQGVINFTPTAAAPSTSTTDFPHQTFRDVINYCTRNHPWVTFGCDLVLGLPTDRTMTLRETFFIPEYLKNAFNKAEIVREGKSAPLVKQVNILAENEQPPQEPPLFIVSPVGCFWLLFILIAALTFYEWRKIKYYRFADVILFFAAGIAGCILFFLSFMSVHPSIFPNINLLWLHPFHLIGIIFFSIKKWKKIANWYHFINFAAIIIMSVCWFFIPQHVNSAFIPAMACLWLRSGWALIRNINSIR